MKSVKTSTVDWKIVLKYSAQKNFCGIEVSYFAFVYKNYSTAAKFSDYIFVHHNLDGLASLLMQIL